MSQPQLATAAGVPVGTLRGWEQGRRRPYIDAAYRVAQALHITLDELVGKAFEEEPSAGKKPARGKRKGKAD
jgi:transcriptional regulator with XRE-family HTH domain